MKIEIKPIKIGNYEDAIRDQTDDFFLPSFEELEKAISHNRFFILQQKELLTKDLIEGTAFVKGLNFFKYNNILMFKEVLLNKNDQSRYVLIRIDE